MDQAVHARRRKGVGETIGSLACFITLLVAVAAIDDRVGDLISLEVSAGKVAGWGERTSHVMFNIAHNQSIENAPLLVLSVVAILLVLFMVKT